MLLKAWIELLMQQRSLIKLVTPKVLLRKEQFLNAAKLNTQNTVNKPIKNIIPVKDMRKKFIYQVERELMLLTLKQEMLGNLNLIILEQLKKERRK